MPEPFRYRVAERDEVHVLIRLGDGELMTVRLLPGSELLLDGPPGKPARGDGGPGGS